MSIYLLAFIALTLALQIVTQQNSYLSNRYFDSIRTGYATFSVSQLEPQTTFFTAVFQRPYVDSAVVQCHVALSSFNIPFEIALENIVSVPPSGCSPASINLSMSSGKKNINVVTYIVVSGELISSPNFVALSLHTQSTHFINDKPATKVMDINSLNFSGQIKHFSFFQGFKLQTINALNQKTVVQRGFEIKINEITSGSLNYSIVILGENTFSGIITALVIAYNNDFFNSDNALMLLGYTKDFINLTDAAIALDLSTDSQALFFAGLNKVYAYGDIVFSLKTEEIGQINVHSNKGLNNFQVHCILFTKRVAKNLNPPIKQLLMVRQLVDTNSSGSDSSNLTTSDSQDIQNPTIMMVIVVAVCCILLLAIVLIGLYCWNKHTDQQQRPLAYIEPPNQSLHEADTNPERNLIRSRVHINQLGKEVCYYCINKKIQLMTPCQHFSHLKCVRQQSMKEQNSSAKNCPICPELIANRKITLFCPRCWNGFVFELQQALRLNADLGVSKICECQQERDQSQAEQVGVELMNRQRYF